MVRIGSDMFQVEAVVFCYPTLGKAHHLRNTGASHAIVSLLDDGWVLKFLIIQGKINGCIGMRASWRILSILPLSATRDYFLIRRVDL